jgi:pilus assembly protein CpaF
MPLLLVEGGDYNQDAIEFGEEEFIIGRSIDADLILNNTQISSQHARIMFNNRSYWLQDMGSRNGTLVNKRKIVQHPLSEGDVFQIAEFTMTFLLDPDTLQKQRDSTVEELRKQLHDELIDKLNLKQLNIKQIRDHRLRAQAGQVLDDLFENRSVALPKRMDLIALKKAILDAALGLGPLEDLLADRDVTEIMVNGHNRIFIEKGGKVLQTKTTFADNDEVLIAIERIVGPLGRRIDESSPMVDARLADGSRVNAIIPPLALDGPSITIRKFPERRLVVDDLIGWGSISRPCADFLELCAEHAQNIVISGGTGSGKTTLLNILSNYIPDGERIVTIEDSAELQLTQSNVVRLETRPPNIEGKGAVTIRDLVKNSLRMRPDRIVVGECRSAETIDMLQAMNTGHDGSLTTTHANSPVDALRRLENMVLMGGVDMPLRAIRDLIFSAVNIIVQISRFNDGSRRVVAVSELVDIIEGEIKLQDIYTFVQTGYTSEGKVCGKYSATGVIPNYVQALRTSGVNVDMGIFVPKEIEV